MGVIRVIIFLALAFFLASGVFTNYAGHDVWDGKKAGFFTGIIHGILAPAMLIAALFTEYTMYEVNNFGWWYNFGFIIGILITWSGGNNINNITKNYYDSSGAKIKSWLGRNKGKDEKDLDELVEEKVEEKVDKALGKKTKGFDDSKKSKKKKSIDF